MAIIRVILLGNVIIEVKKRVSTIQDTFPGRLVRFSRRRMPIPTTDIIDMLLCL